MNLQTNENFPQTVMKKWINGSNKNCEDGHYEQGFHENG